ncbi:hypothetical protein [Sorangium sp. So ce887]
MITPSLDGPPLDLPLRDGSPRRALRALLRPRAPGRAPDLAERLGAGS